MVKKATKVSMLKKALKVNEVSQVSRVILLTSLLMLNTLKLKDLISSL